MTTELKWIKFDEATPPFSEIFLACVNDVVSPCILNKIDSNGVHMYCYNRRKTVSKSNPYYTFQAWASMPKINFKTIKTRTNGKENLCRKRKEEIRQPKSGNTLP